MFQVHLVSMKGLCLSQTEIQQLYPSVYKLCFEFTWSTKQEKGRLKKWIGGGLIYFKHMFEFI